MVSQTGHPAFGDSDSPMDILIKLSRFYGADPDYILAGGGNTSMKTEDRLFVKGSGSSLAVIGVGGFVEMDRRALATLVESELSADVTQREEQFKHAIMAARIQPEKGQRPSVEAVLHHVMPGKFVVHSHATLANMITCCKNGEALAKELFGDQVIWLPFVDPGFMLAKALHTAMKEYRQTAKRDCPTAVLMQNHGLIVCGDTSEEIFKRTDWVINTIRLRLEATSGDFVFGEVSKENEAAGRKWTSTIGPALRGLLAVGESLKVVTFDDSATVLGLVGGTQGAATVQGGPLNPDQIVYCKAFPMWFELKEEETTEQLVERLRLAVAEHEKTKGFPPYVILVKGLGMFTAGDDFSSAHIVRLVYIDAIKVMAGAKRLGGINYMSTRDREFIENWEVESYRRKVAAGGVRPGRVVGKVAVVTGAAQGFGMEIAQHFAAEGGHVVLADMNVQGAEKAARDINGKTPGRALGLGINVTDGMSIEEAMHQVVRTFGGFDVFISNAGVLKAASVKVQPEKDFDFVTSVNYKGYFLCVQKASAIFAVQHLAKKDYMSDIIQINSKSGLQGSNKNAAYAGSKFGGIGLTQSFAMELIEDGVKVNSICPGNFFDGPLWSDPNNGLFVQYLRTGKVPGAKTIEDVKRSYEAKVPMGRGCTTPDVMKAIFYLMDQKYETGQAVPVTGGQVMLN
jgi:rhamnose utilization protein RhaD (predicted bifunctional aldolase and dehydrogenase)/NAD(P)-dependent dehydrogenase (short-subunit alcohol dehydrogenase family)